MVTICAWCNRYLGPPDGTVTHGICTPCALRQHWRDAPILVVSPHREAMVPVLRHLLQGSPEVRIVVDRRRDQRRRSDPSSSSLERRSGRDRRRWTDLLLT